ncbi:MAG: T9SS type A sorting domain-containing protein [Flavobacteriales bacterium]|nr:T9SS type A sorting domain-containing protein [Flavobacteriales bacterium]
MIKRILLSVIWLLVAGTIHAQPAITSDGPLEFCNGESVTLCVEPAYSSYLWNNGSTTQCITVTESGDYWVTLLDSQGNVDSTFVDSVISVTVHSPEPLLIQNGDTIAATNADQFESFQWFWLPTEEPIPNETNSFIVDSIVPCCPCCYKLEVTDSTGCTGLSYCIEFPVLLPDSCYNGINESNALSFTLFPNPTANRFTIQNGNKPTIGRVSIWDSSGKQVLERALSIGKDNLSIETKNWPNGIYFVSVMDQAGHQLSGKLIVQHE